MVSVPVSRLDTLAEKNTPQALDYAQHQLFIDTSRTSTHCTQLKNWQPSQWDHQAVQSSLKAINNHFQPQKVTVESFPTHFITLRKYQNEWILYDRCDGMDRRLELRDTAVVFYGPLESYGASIEKVLVQSGQTLALQIKLHPNAEPQSRQLKITQLESFVYNIMLYELPFGQMRYATVPEAIDQFDLLVNHCPTQKVIEFDDFDPL